MLSQGRALVTLVLDFSNIISCPPDEFAGIIVLRLTRQDKQSVLEVLQKLLIPLSSDPLAGKLWIVDESRVRVRG